MIAYLTQPHYIDDQLGEVKAVKSRCIGLYDFKTLAFEEAVGRLTLNNGGIRTNGTN